MKNQSMRHRLNVGLLLVGFLWIGSSNTAVAAPRAVLVEPDHIDAGQVEPSDILHYTFILRNEGDENLAIEDLQPTCYCTTAKTDRWDVPPGGSAHIKVRIDPSDFVGELNKGVEISTNDPSHPMLLVDVALNVRPGIAIVPPEIDFGTVGPEGTQSQKIDIKAPRERNLEVLRLSSEATYLELDHEPLELEDRTGAMVFVKVLPGAPSGAFQTKVIVHTNDDARPTIEIPVHGKGPGGLTAEPERIVFQVASAGADVGWFEVKGGSNLQVSSSSESLQPRLEKLENGGYRVHLKLAQDARAGRLLAKVFVSNGEDAGLTVPVMGLVR